MSSSIRPISGGHPFVVCLKASLSLPLLSSLEKVNLLDTHFLLSAIFSSPLLSSVSTLFLSFFLAVCGEDPSSEVDSHLLPSWLARHLRNRGDSGSVIRGFQN